MAFLLDILDDDLVEREAKIIENEHLERFRDSQWSSRDAVVTHLLFPDGHPYHGLGENLDLDGVELRHVRWFFQTHYRPDNATLAIVGDFASNEAEELVRRYFEPVVAAGRAPPRSVPAAVWPKAERRAVVRQRVRYEGVVFAWPGPKEGDPDGAALDILATCLVGTGSDLRRALVTRGRSALDVGAHRWDLSSQSLVVLEALASYDVDIDGIRRVLDSEVAKLRFDATKYCDIDGLRAAARASLLESMDHYVARARHLAKTGVSLGHRLELLNDLSPARIEDAARRYLADSTRLVVELRWQSSNWGTFQVDDE